jgi:myo-inositol-1(or 4)-monophosphatase
VNYSEILKKLEPVVKEAGSIIMSYQNKDKGIEYKDIIDLVTEADRKSEIFICNELNKAFPADSILAEEGFKKEGTSGYTWVIDPLDGTTSFAHGFPFFCISAGLINSEKKPVAGMVYAPMLAETFTAFKNGGAYLNGKLITVSSVNSLNKALVGTGFPYDRRQKMDKLTSRLGKFLYVVHDVRRTGSAAMDISYVACGRLDAYFEEGLQPWDVAASVIILEEAGGKVTKFDGSAGDIFYRETAASNRIIHDQLIEILVKN